MNCKFCGNKLSDSQVYQFIIGKSKGTCSKRCGGLSTHYSNIDQIPKYSNNGYILFPKKCSFCEGDFYTVSKNQKFCSTKCAGKLSSKRMVENNPMKNEDIRKKVSNTLKKIKHKPKQIGGNGRGITKYQEMIFNELKNIDDSFCCEYILKTSIANKDKKYPNHYKIDVASEKYKIAIEVDGSSHNSIKVKLCDKKKTDILNFLGWKILRFWNYQIETELNDCVLMVMSMI